MNRTFHRCTTLRVRALVLLGVACFSSPGPSAQGFRHVAVPLPGGSNPSQLTRVAGRVLFTATDPTLGNVVRRTDGTTAGTEWLADFLPPGEPFYGGVLLAPTAKGVALQAPDGSIHHARARLGGADFLFRPEGEFPGAVSGFRLGGKAHFFVIAGDLPEATLELWQVDGRPEGNRKLAEIARFHPFIAYDLRVAVAADRQSAYFFPVATDGEVGDIGDGLWATDGSPSGTRRVVADPCAPAPTCGWAKPSSAPAASSSTSSTTSAGASPSSG